MEIRVLAIGDVVGENGLDFLARHLRPLKQEKGIDFTVVNGENASGVGIVPGQAAMLFGAGTDVITLENHTYDKQQIIPMLDELYVASCQLYIPCAGARHGILRLWTLQHSCDQFAGQMRLEL